MKKFIFMFLLAMVFNSFFGITDSEIDQFLKTYKEEGYTFNEKISKYLWSVNFKSEDWEKGWDVYVYLSKNNDSPDYNLIYVFSILKSNLKTLPTELSEFLLNANQYDNNWGNYAISYNKDDTVNIYYIIKLLQNDVDKDILVRAIGFNAGYSYSVVNTINKLLGKK